jgi:hypothetical protein
VVARCASFLQSIILNTISYSVIDECPQVVKDAKPTERILKGHEARHVISCEADRKLWEPLARLGYPIYSKEIILVASLTQQLDLDKREFRLDSVS